MKAESTMISEIRENSDVLVRKKIQEEISRNEFRRKKGNSD